MAKNKNTATRQVIKPSSSLPANRHKAVVIANGLAAVFMFVSWLGQNFYQNEKSSEKSDIQILLQFESSEMSKVNTWLLAFQQELRKEQPDPEIILNSAITYAMTRRIGDGPRFLRFLIGMTDKPWSVPYCSGFVFSAFWGAAGLLYIISIKRRN